jgi:hypothetical protein
VRTEGLSVLAALAVHAGLLLAARSMPAPTLSASQQKPIDTIDIELPATPPAPIAVREVTPVPVSPDAPRGREPERQPDARVPARTLPNQGPETPATPGPPDTNPGTAPTTAQPGSRFDELPDEQRGGVLGLPGVPGLGNQAWTMPGVLEGGGRAPPAPTVAPAARPVDKDIAGIVIRDAMQGHDKEIGIDLPGAGNVGGAVRTAVQGADLPDVTKATLQFRLGPNGQVLGVSVLSSSSGSSEAWQRVAKNAAAQLTGRTFEMGQRFAKGAMVTVNVSSNLQAPAGSKGGLQGAGVAFDVSNIGAHATKNVRTSYTVAAIR